MNYGDPSLPESFWEKCIPEPNSGCWLWTGAISGPGYASFAVKRRTCNAHTLTAIAEHGPRPDGLVLDHKCRMRSCVNPAHLEFVTERVNCHRSPPRMAGKGSADLQRAKTHCAQGHAFTPENTIHGTQGGRRGKRVSARRRCRMCMARNYAR